MHDGGNYLPEQGFASIWISWLVLWNFDGAQRNEEKKIDKKNVRQREKQGR